ncbi:branched-chain amino acid ABC transporter permease [Halococcus sediminicola]|uniref:branched-chain amino acid ABC transporter permease n=1 Tax=Halococcus sediminicola TaxID=1264579 RepID=UPI000678A8B9|nr:branched-chain amino acid ABC transporter permease [Halococcus sediminicola]
MIDFSVLVNGLLLSSLYALIAMGFTMIFGIGGVLNVAHGASITVGGFAMYYTTSTFGLNPWYGALAALIVPGIFSAVVYVGLVRWIEDDPIIVVITTLLVLLLIERSFLLVAGSQGKVVPSLISGQLEIGSISVGLNRVLAFVVSWILILALLYFVERTRMGTAIRALSMSERGSALAGINEFRISVMTWFIAGVLAGAAGLFLGTFQTVGWDMGLDPLLLGFAIVIFGGLGSIRGSVIAAYIIGFIDVLTTTYVDATLTGMSAFIILMVILIARPEGLFGHAEVS